MVTDYIQVAMHKAHYELIEDGTFVRSIPGFQGLWANAETLEACRDELQSVLEDWIKDLIWFLKQLVLRDHFGK